MFSIRKEQFQAIKAQMPSLFGKFLPLKTIFGYDFHYLLLLPPAPIFTLSVVGIVPQFDFPRLRSDWAFASPPLSLRYTGKRYVASK